MWSCDGDGDRRITLGFTFELILLGNLLHKIAAQRTQHQLLEQWEESNPLKYKA